MVKLESTIKYVCFDIGGVLFKIRGEWPHLLRKNSIEWRQFPYRKLEDYPLFINYQNGEITSSEYIKSLSRDLGITQEKAEELHMSILKSPYPHVDFIIESLNSQGFITGCLSNTNEYHWDMLISHFAIGQAQIKLPSHQYGISKPNEMIFKTFESLALCRNSEEILFFDDNPLNVMAAKAAGWHAHSIHDNSNTAPQIIYWLSKHGISCNIPTNTKV